MTTGLLIISHDNVGNALVETASSILGIQSMTLEIVSVSPGCVPETMVEKACAAVRRLNKGDGVLVLTDMYGATPSNVANRLGEEIPVKVVAGMNLPMLVRVLNYPELSLEELAYKAISGGQEGILSASQASVKVKTVEIINKLGLHARAASKFVKLASRFESRILLRKGEREANGKSIMGVMMLAACQGSKLELVADGKDEQEAHQALEDLIADRFGEGE